MSALLDDAIEQLRELPEDEQDAAADALFAYIASDERQYRIDKRDADEVQQIRRDLVSGATRLATEKEVTTVRGHSN